MCNAKCNETAMCKKVEIHKCQNLIRYKRGYFSLSYSSAYTNFILSSLCFSGVRNNKRKEREKSDEQFAICFTYFQFQEELLE